MWTLLCLICFAVAVGATTEAPFFPSTCGYLPGVRLVGGDVSRRPLRDLSSPSACCDACLQYRGKERCVGYTFYPRNSGTECWLKTRSAVAQPGFMADSGFPNFYYNESFPDLSSDLGEAFSGLWDVSEMASVRFSLQLVEGEWKFKTALVDNSGGETALNPAFLPGFGGKKVPEECDLKGVEMNQAWVGTGVASLPILNLKCPEDCRDACFKHQQESGRYSCVAYNFKYALPVTECWLKAAPFGRVPRLGMASGLSGRKGHEMGPYPTEAERLRDIYLGLIEKSNECIEKDDRVS